MISHMKIWVSTMADVGLMSAVENFHFKAFNRSVCWAYVILGDSSGNKDRSGGIEGDRSFSWGD